MLRRRLQADSDTHEKAPKNSIAAVDRNLCHFCGACVAVCPPDAIFLVDTWLEIKANCTGCERCVTVCPVRALSMVSQEKRDEVPV